MHPYPHVLLHRGPSRILWFLVGAGVATWWHYAPIVHDHRAQFFPCVMRRRALDLPPPPQEPLPDQSTAGWSHQRDWEQDRERIRQLQHRAGETVVDLSESTLESIISGAESLKAKLIQLRAERERLEAEKKAALPAA